MGVSPTVSDQPHGGGRARLYGSAPQVAEALRNAGFTVLDGDGPAELHCVPLLGEVGAGVPAVPRERLLAALAAARRDGAERFVLVTDAAPFVQPEADPDRTAALAADTAWWRWLAARAATRGVPANTVRVGHAPFLGHRLDAAAAEALSRHQLVRRPAEPADLVAALRLLSGVGGGYLAGETVPLDGGLDAVYIPPVSALGGQSQPTGPAGPPAPPSTGPVLVAGASSGIGAATALRLAAEGAETVLVARRAEPLRRIAAEAEELGAVAHVLPADLSDPAVVPRLLDEAHELTGGIERLCYTAGVLRLDRPRVPADSAEARELMMRTNVASFAAMCENLVARWIDRGIPGVIASVSSVTAHSAPLSHCHSYGATKAAVAQYTRMLATTVARYGIRANVVRPGIIRTPMAGTADDSYQQAWLERVPLGRVGEPAEVGALLCALLGPDAAYLTGTHLLVDGGLHLGPIPPLRAGQRAPLAAVPSTAG